MSHRRRYIADCRAVIQERVILLEYELATTGQSQSERAKACDRAAIDEARFLWQLLSHLEDAPYPRKNPYQESQRRGRWSDGSKLPSLDHGEEWFWNPTSAAKALEKPNA